MKVDMNKMMQECMKPHNLVHLVTGAGLGMVAMAVVPELAMLGWVAGVTVVVVGVVLDLMVQSK